MTARHRARDLRRSGIPHVEMRGDRPVAVVGRYEYTVQGTSVSTSAKPGTSLEEQNRALAGAQLVWAASVMRPPYFPINLANRGSSARDDAIARGPW